MYQSKKLEQLNFYLRRFHISSPLRLIKKTTKAALETRNQRIEILDKREELLT